MTETGESTGHKGNPPHRLSRQMSKAIRINGGNRSFWIVEKLLLNWMKKRVFRLMMLIMMISGILHTPVSYCPLFSYVSVYSR